MSKMNIVGHNDLCSGLFDCDLKVKIKLIQILQQETKI